MREKAIINVIKWEERIHLQDSDIFYLVVRTCKAYESDSKINPLHWSCILFCKTYNIHNAILWDDNYVKETLLYTCGLLFILTMYCVQLEYLFLYPWCACIYREMIVHCTAKRRSQNRSIDIREIYIVKVSVWHVNAQQCRNRLSEKAHTVCTQRWDKSASLKDFTYFSFRPYQIVAISYS